MPYIPESAKPLTDDPTFKVALQSSSGQGKTFTSATFPNPLYLNFDKNLQALTGRTDINQVPFWDDTFVDKIIARGNTLDRNATPLTCRPNRRDALLIWLNKEGPKFTPDQTVILDSWTKAQDAFDIQQGIEPHYTQKGGIDEFAFWAYKQDWSRDVCDLLNSLNCNVVVTFHEQRLTDEKGKVLDAKYIPLQQGRFVNRLGLYFSEWYRCYFFPKGTPCAEPFIPQMILAALNLKDKLTEDLGLWQTKSSVYSDCKTRIPNCPIFIKASYQELTRLYKANVAK